MGVGGLPGVPGARYERSWMAKPILVAFDLKRGEKSRCCNDST